MTKNDLIQRMGGLSRVKALAESDGSVPFDELLSGGSDVRSSLLSACGHVQRVNPKWFDSFCKKRLQREKDPRNILAALGELRAYADLLSLPGISVRPHDASTSGSDFTLVKNNDAIAMVEVFTLLPRPNSSMEIGGGVVDVTPLTNRDSERPGASIAKDAISKICGIKEDEHQVDVGVPTIYYVDVQDLLGGFSFKEMFLPLTSQNGAVFSGNFYQAFYGNKGDAVQEGSRVGDLYVNKMEHAGRYQNKEPSLVTAFLFRMAAGSSRCLDPLVCFENPRKPLPQQLNRMLSACDLFNWDLSVSNMSKGCVSRFVSISNRAINAVESYMNMTTDKPLGFARFFDWLYEVVRRRC